MRPLTTFALLLLAAMPAAAAQQPGPTVGATARQPSLSELELAVERSCDDHQRARACRATDGSTAFQCVARSPLAAVLHWLERRPKAADEDVEVKGEVETRVEVQRLAPPAAPAPAPTAGAAASPAARVAAAAPATERRVVVRRGGELPECRR